MQGEITTYVLRQGMGLMLKIGEWEYFNGYFPDHHHAEFNCLASNIFLFTIGLSVSDRFNTIKKAVPKNIRDSLERERDFM